MDGGIFFDKDKKPAPDDLQPVLSEVSENGRPACVDADGLNLVDDCGGMYGYLDMLRTIHGDDPLEVKEMKDWARGLGWTGRKSKPENML